MGGVIIDDPCTAIERIILELRVAVVEAVKLKHVARTTLLVGDLAQIGIGAPMLLVASAAK
jgi:hypothetical protein